MKLLYSVLLLILFLSCSPKTSAQDLNAYYSHLNEEKWFPHQSVRCMFQDSKGYLWIGTNAGLFRYNTYELTNYDMSKYTRTKFFNNTVNNITEDLQGNIVVSSESGAALVDPTTNRRKVLTQTDEFVPQVLVSKAGEIWFFNNRQEIYKVKSPAFDNKKSTLYLNLSKIKGFENCRIRQLYFDLNGELFMACNTGLYKIDQQNKSIVNCGLKQDVKKILVGDFGTVFVVLKDGLFTLKTTGNSEKYTVGNPLVKSTEIQFLTGDSPKIVIAASSEQVYAVKDYRENMVFKTLVTNELRLNNIVIQVIFIDKASNIWLGTQKGLYKINSQKIAVNYYHKFSSEATYRDHVNDLLYDNKGKLWVLTSTQGLYTLDLNSNQLKKFNSPYKNYRMAKKTLDGKLMFFSEKCVLEVPDANSKSYRIYPVQFPGYINDVVEVSPGEWWLTSWQQGLIRFLKPGIVATDTTFFNTIKKKLNNFHLFGIIKSSNNQIWMISRGDGIIKVDLNTKKLYHYTENGPLTIPSNRLVCIKEDSKNHIWVGTRGAGILKYLPATDSFKSYDVNSGLPSNTICDIEESSSGDIWVSTLNGIAMFQSEQLMPFYPFGIDDGIFNAEFNFSTGASASNDELFFGSGDGFFRVRYLPKSGPTKTYPVVWTKFKILNNNPLDTNNITKLQQIQRNGSITLSSDERSVSINFAALDYSNPQKIRYAYRLKGAEKTWQFLPDGQSGVQYLDIKPGEYDFQVRVANNRGEWSSTPEQFHISVIPSFLETKLALLLYLFILVSGCYFGWYLWKRWYKLNMKLESELEVSQFHNQQMIQYADLSHEIKNRLTLILGPLEQALHGKKVNQTVLNNLYEQAQRLKRLSDQIINIRKNESGGYVLNVAEENMVNHFKQIFTDMQPLALVKNVAVTFTCQLEKEVGWYDKELMEIIILNVLGNAIKYSTVNGNVSFSITDKIIAHNEGKNRRLIIKITDNGIGIPKTEISKILDPFYRSSNARQNKKEFPGDGIGLNLVSRLTKIHHGIIKISSTPNVLTTVELNIPISKEEYAVNELRINVTDTQIILADTDQNNNPLITPGGDIEVYNFRDKKIVLIVDDEKEIRNLLKDGLKEDFVVLEAGDGLEAIQILSNNPVNIVLSDLSMPNMDGLSLCAWVRQNKKYSHLPFLLITARNSAEQKLIAFKSQIDDFIEKPFSMELISWKVKAMLRQHEMIAQNVQKVILPLQQVDYSDSPDEIFIQKVVSTIDKNLDNEFLNVDLLADELSMSRATFYRKMEGLFGESPSTFIKKSRLKKALLYVKTGKYTVSEIAVKTGFKTSNYFSKCFHKEFGQSPSDYLDNN